MTRGGPACDPATAGPRCAPMTAAGSCGWASGAPRSGLTRPARTCGSSIAGRRCGAKTLVIAATTKTRVAVTGPVPTTPARPGGSAATARRPRRPSDGPKTTNIAAVADRARVPMTARGPAPIVLARHCPRPGPNPPRVGCAVATTGTPTIAVIGAAAVTYPVRSSTREGRPSRNHESRMRRGRHHAVRMPDLNPVQTPAQVMAHHPTTIGGSENPAVADPRSVNDVSTST